MLLIGPLGVMLHNIKSAQNPTLSNIFGPFNIFSHGATKTPNLKNGSYGSWHDPIDDKT